MKLARSQVALGILAGGQASRMGGTDKALAMHEGARLIDRALAALGNGYAATLVSYNRDASALPTGLRAVPDLRADFPAPLAGIEDLLAATDAHWLLSVPVDIDAIPEDLFEQLSARGSGGQGIAARDAQGPQPLVALWRVAASRPAVSAALDSGDGAVHRLQSALGFTTCDFTPSRFGNLNTPAELSR
jgi:molybdopterin-guanine dinucleotide biosynthesis protein A